MIALVLRLQMAGYTGLSHFWNSPTHMELLQTGDGKWTTVWLPGIGMGIALGALFVGFILIRSKMLRASEKSRKALEEMETLVKEEKGEAEHDETSG